jgi:hypothetical protein
MGRSPWSKNVEFGAKDTGLKILSFGPQKWANVLRIQETVYRPHFTCGGILYFLKHYKHTARCVNSFQMPENCVRALTKNQKTRHACAPSWPQRCSCNIRKRNLLSG